MESQEQQPSLDSLNVDGNVSLLSSPNASTPEQPNDDAMDLFLNQVADYNSQHLNLNHHDANSNHCAVMDPSQVLLHHHQQQHTKLESAGHSLDSFSLENQHLLKVDGASKPALETSSDGGSSSVATSTSQQQQQQQQQKSKGKGKENNGGGGGLLNAFANPLLHAIPVLARNCLNFEDFLAQAALQGQNGLLGPKMQKADSYAAPDKLMLDPSKDSFSGKVGSPWHIRVLGLPSSGAKSRVETQIKVCIQLVNSNNELATEFSHLRLPEHMVAKEKLKRKHQKGDDRSALVESKVLRLEAAVVCDSHPDNEIIMCTSCVHRERKRLKRKRDNKVARAANKEGNAAKLAALFANDLPNLEDEEVMAQERRKILLFNCSEYIEFNEGEATLPTRVTCYCRHHSEKIGFRIVFTVKDSQNHVLATGRSPPIMITDDHKSSKVQTAAAAAATAAAAARKRTRSDFDVPEVPSSVKRKALNDGETDSGVSSPSPIVSAPPTPTSQGDDVPSSPRRKQQQNGSVATSSPSNHNSTNGAQNFLSHQPSQSSSFSNNIQQIPQGELFDFLHSEDINMDHLLQAPPTTVPESSHQASSSNSSNSSSSTSTQRHVPLQAPFSAPLYRSRRTNGMNGMGCSQQQQQWQASNLYARMQQKNAMMERTKSNNLPKLHRLIPSEGPIYGGAEVTVLGANFYEGLTCMFGENPAMPTHCWSANTLLCILPPAANAGPVVVSFKEHPLMLEGQDVVLFTYFDESDRALMELALQVVGLKTMGRVEDARQIAMRIVQGDHGNSNNKNNNTTTTSNNNTNQHDALALQTPRVGYRQMLTTKAAMAVYENARALCIGGRLEEQVIAALISAMDYYNGELSLTNGNQHSLLHLATICGYDRLVRVLVKLGCDVDQPDHNGFTALHFASWTGKVDIVQALIYKANLQARNIMGKTAEKMALEAGHAHVVELFKRMPRRTTKKNSRRRRSHQLKEDDETVRIPLTDFIPSEAVETARAVLPTRLNNMLSTFYTFSINTSCVKNLGNAVGQVYNFMLDPF
ncbi:hypothetical protein LRAMOSA03268 [Lichtheimia ramosa]|uniref:IPT/TIG domain-containing protein n=1 Tax=Lichtheimia ramosa TaxID=688394 RepID=A0A077WUT3_9FUNG|nr:hypothetical protein LRAMOSA03268 [Lichtheimia ramosa]